MASIPATRIAEREFVVLVALLQALQALAIDAMLPALGAIAHDLAAPHPNDRQLIIGGFLIGSGLGALIPGILADRYGRRPVLFGCLIAYCALNLACALVGDFEMLIALRVLTGFATAGMTVLPAAMIRDRFEGDRMARLQSLVAMIFMIVPVVAPSLGQAVLLFAGWRWIFGIMALMAAMLLGWSFLRLEESLPREYRQPIAPSRILANMHEILTTRASIGYILAMSSTTAMFFNFLSSSQQLIAEHFGAGGQFPLIFGVMASMLALSNFTNSRLVMRFGARRVSHCALLIYLFIGVLHILSAFSPHQTLWQFGTLMGLTMCLTGFISANFSAIALQPFSRMAGIAASLLTFLRMVIGAIGGVLVGLAFDGTPRPLALTIVIAGTMALALVLWSERGVLFRRLNYPPASK
jgi:DHA1 family bicyclomycin/chloramphenicol resistance-like MFS transporter